MKRHILVIAVVLYWHYALWLYIKKLKRDPILAKLLEEN